MTLNPLKLHRQPWVFYRYIIGETARPFMGAAVFFMFVLLMFQVIRLTDVMVVHNVSGNNVMMLLFYLALTFIPVIIPIAFLLAVLLGFGRLSGDGEVLAMRAAGVSVYTMVAPVFALGCLLAGFTMFCNLYFVPFGARQFRHELYKIYNSKAIATIHEGTFTTEGFFDLVLYSQTVDSKKNLLSNVLIYDERKKDSPITVIARRGQILNNLADAAGTPGLVLRLMEGNLHRGDPSKALYEKTDFDVYDIFLSIGTGANVGMEAPRAMEIGRLSNRIDELKAKLKSGVKFSDFSQLEKDDYLSFGVEFHKRFALAASCFIFALMGVAFGVIRTRTVRSNSFLICLLVLLFYWGVYSAGTNLSASGQLPAFIGMWAANAILLPIAVYTLRKVAR
ncbi:MAG: LPS export ABC transporter permease LptF [Proteobacteria bacterium]|nr:MAG: LPS export ABC transporter permease LptF [Pseudomonadota bacterium]